MTVHKGPAFVSEEGKMILPSYFTKEQERQFKIEHDHRYGDLNLADSMRITKSYEIFDEYKDTFKKLDATDLNYVSFIGQFASVQMIHIRRMCILFPDNFGPTRKIEKIMMKLRSLGLVDRLKFVQPNYSKKKIPAYTLTGHGHRFANYIFNRSFEYHPNKFQVSNETQHIRRWQLADIYQAMLSIPGYRGIIHYFRGFEGTPLPLSSCVFSLQVSSDATFNFVTYSILMNDNPNFHYLTLEKWRIFKAANGEEKPIANLMGDSNVLCLYVPELSKAEEITRALTLTSNRIDIEVMFLIGEIIATKGIAEAFYAPITGNEEDEEQLEQFPFNYIINQDNRLITPDHDDIQRQSEKVKF